MSVEEIIREAIKEDVGSGDHASLLAVPDTACGKAELRIKEDGVIAGVDIALQVFKHIDRLLKTTIFILDGNTVKINDIVFVVEGSVRSILIAERLVLNIMQRMSGIATKTKYFCELIKGTNARLLDTRKTTPNFRLLEKMAVRIGGGYNHRMGLYDMIMLKDNHIDYAGGIENAIKKANDYVKSNHLDIKIEIETRSLDEVEKALSVGGFHRMMFDNFTVENVRKGVEMVNKRYETEASGNINEHTIRQYAQTSVDFISVGALTHSVKGLDMSLKAII
ncbi:MAG: carboxylating nicotinate-nucleotide diphosphorylase [Bacteroidales bacterium]|jgi:nicotinate-nucleotide pyrophosphorylase (carboxylating)|nr:carboxylating nicotinate-nucleotide diphosphorylase [Bacteroidales bacterium]